MTLNLPSPGRTRVASTPPRLLLAVAMLVAIWAGLPEQLAAQRVRDFELELPEAASSAIPKGWLGISTTETDLNGDGFLDTAVLIAPEDRDQDEILDTFGPIRGTKLTDRCRNLIVLLGKAGEDFAAPHFFPASNLFAHLVSSPNDMGIKADCTSKREPAGAVREITLFRNVGGPVADQIRNHQNLLGYQWSDETDQTQESLLLRLEGDCFRVLSGKFEEATQAEGYGSKSVVQDNLARRKLESDFDASPLGPSASSNTLLPLSQRPEADEFICRSGHQPPITARDTGSPPVSPPPKTTDSPEPKVANASAVQDPRWAQPPAGSRLSWARWSRGPSESYLRLLDGTVITRPGVTLWSSRGPVRLAVTPVQEVEEHVESCPQWMRVEEPTAEAPENQDITASRCALQWQKLSVTDAMGSVLWTLPNPRASRPELTFLEQSLELLASDNRGLLLRTDTTWLISEDYFMRATRAWWVDPSTGEEISRSWPSEALATVEREFAEFTTVHEQLACSDSYQSGCVSNHAVEPPRPLAARYFQPVPTCGPIQEWTWTTTLAPYTAEEIAESPNLQCYTGVAREDETYEPCQPEDDVSNPWSVQTTMSPYDPGVVPTVDCTYPATGEPPIAVGWSALVP